MTAENSGKKKSLQPLKITCTSTNCDNNLHCFRMTKKLLANGPAGRCRNCGVQLVDWPRVHNRNLADTEYTFAKMRLELIRHHFWHISLTQKAINYARRKGRVLLRVAAEKQIRQLVGSSKHPREGFQTPRETSKHANSIHFAQHATASCCRHCLAEWHGIPEGRPLADDEIRYLTELAMRYLCARIPDLAELPIVVPAIRAEKVNAHKGPRRPVTDLEVEHRNAG
jgi:hypothetical protein